MSVRTKLAGFGVGLLAVFGAAFLVGSAVGPLDDTSDTDPATTHQQDEHPADSTGGHQG